MSTPKPIRRVVVGNKNGASAVLGDTSTVRTFETLPTFSNTLIWTTPSTPKVGPQQLAADPVPSNRSLLPSVGGTSFMIVTFPPDAHMADPSFDGASFGAEAAQKMPGLAQTFEPEDPVMHVTDTVDYGVVLDGEIWLDLGSGEEVHLKQHDVIVQNGSRHGWRNKGNSAATMMFVLIGAERQPG